MVAPRRVLSETAFEAREESLPLDPKQLGLESGLHPSSEQVRKILRTRVMESQRLWYEAKVELQERMSTALAPLCFVAIGVPLGIWLRHGNRLVSFGASLLVVFALYIPALVAGKQMSLDGLIPAPVGLWLPNALMVAAGLLFGKRIRY
jgi:lipopolysaccharide export LptBFGC system permease protein LptF